MNRIILALLMAALGCFNCRAASGSDVPSSRRAREAIARVRPALIEDLAAQDLSLASPIFIRIFKEEMELELWMKKKAAFRLFRTYRICNYGSRGLGPKTKKGDGMAPEGFYSVTPGQMNPASNFHLAFNLGYPNAYDRAHGRSGSALMVHGDCVSIGCYAMSDPAIEEIYALADAALRNGQNGFRAHIFPFRMTGPNLKKHSLSPWHAFWTNLKEGYDLFEKNHQPPDVRVVNKHYMY